VDLGEVRGGGEHGEVGAGNIRFVRMVVLVDVGVVVDQANLVETFGFGDKFGGAGSMLVSSHADHGVISAARYW
jgi:hypothetical protein